MDTTINIGVKLKKEREKKGISQKELAQKLGISSRTVGRIETGRVKLDISRIQEIATAIGVPWENVIKDFPVDQALEFHGMREVLLNSAKHDFLTPEVVGAIFQQLPYQHKDTDDKRTTDTISMLNKFLDNTRNQDIFFHTFIEKIEVIGPNRIQVNYVLVTPEEKKSQQEHTAEKSDEDLDREEIRLKKRLAEVEQERALRIAKESGAM